MPRTQANGIEIEFETFGDPDDPALLMVMGLGAQMVAWDEDFCHGLVDRGFHVIRFDNRDVGLSSKVDVPDDWDPMAAILSGFSGGEAQALYRLADMAADAVGLLDALEIEAAHLVGASMGGMIVQQFAIDHADRVCSLTSIMSTTGDLDVGAPDPEVLPVLIQPPPAEREASIEHAVAGSRAIGSPDHFDEDMARARAERSFDRCFYPLGVGNQLAAIMASGSRTDALRSVDRPALVIHGDADPLVDVSGGRRTAEAIPGAELMVIEGMGHDLPRPFWAPVIEAVTALAARSAAGV